MRHILIASLLFFSVILYTQAQGGRGGRSPQNQNRQPREGGEIKVLKAIDLAGILIYDAKEVLKKAKVKDAVLKEKVRNAVRTYNAKVKEISFLNSDKLKGIDEILKSIRGNRNNRGNVRKKIEEAIRPIRKKVRENEIVLNETLESILSEKQNKKWLKYQKKEKDLIRPKRPKGKQNKTQKENRQRRF